MIDLPPGFAGAYFADLICPSPLILEKQDLLGALQTRLPEIESLDRNPTGGMLMFVHPNHMINLKDASIPAQLIFSVSDDRPKVDFLRESIQQSWRFPDAARAVDRCRGRILMGDMMSFGLDRHLRVELFQLALAAVLPLIQCDAVHFHASRQLLSPGFVLEELSRSPSPNLFAGGVNVRMFKIENGVPKNFVMDTLGLSAIGLCDLQCHFHSFDPSPIARSLYNIAKYIFDNGDVIDDGETVDGITPGSRWRCRHEMAIVPPERMVLDLNPGPAYAAGKRRK